jgi:hypothetical protein
VDWLDEQKAFSKEIKNIQPTALAATTWMATLASVQLVGKDLGVSCASPGASVLLGLTGVATASIASAGASRWLSARQQEHIDRSKRERRKHGRNEGQKQQQSSTFPPGAVPDVTTVLPLRGIDHHAGHE